MKTLSAVTAVVLAVAVAGLLAQADLEPARFFDGSLPSIPPLAVSGGDVLLSASVSAGGKVTAVDVLRSTPPFTDAVVQAVRGWVFMPALDAKRQPMDAHVVVDAVIGAPTVRSPTLGTPPKDVAPPDRRVPYPAQTTAPVYPINARSAGTVLVETRVNAKGEVVAVTAVRSMPPFDAPALDAARAWTFQPATGPNAPPSTYAYLLFVFRQPIVGPAPK